MRFKILDLCVLTLLVILALYPPSWLKWTIPAEDHGSWDRAQLLTFLATMYALIFSFVCVLHVLLESWFGTSVATVTRWLAWTLGLAILVVGLRHSLLAILARDSYESFIVGVRYQLMYAFQVVPSVCAAGGMTCLCVCYLRTSDDGIEKQRRLELIDVLVSVAFGLWCLIWAMTPFFPYLPIPGLRTSGFPW